VDGLFAFVKKYYPQANEKQQALLMEFVLHGLAAYSLISKKTIEGKVAFKDLIGSMMNMGDFELGEDDQDDDLNEDDYR
ncbi:MAG: magnesium chelatase, partial [Sediminibacterium sp.]